MEEQPEHDQLSLFAGEASSTPHTLSAQQAAFLALVDIRGVGEATLRSILKGFPDLPAVFTSDQAHLAAMLADVGVRRSTAVATEVSKRRDFRSAAEPLAERLRRQGVSLILDDDPRFPARLRNIKDPPRWLFVEGTSEVISRTDAVAVVGTRQASSGGISKARRLGQWLAEHGFVVVSGLAEGIDQAVHQSSLDFGRPDSRQHSFAVEAEDYRFQREASKD